MRKAAQPPHVGDGRTAPGPVQQVEDEGGRFLPLARFSLAALDPELLFDVFYAAKKVVKFKLRFPPQTRDILTHVSEILPCFGLKGREFILRYHTIKSGIEFLLRYHTIESGVEFLFRYHSLDDNA
jgi:hypothetical protein